jgi:hypothetical protein
MVRLSTTTLDIFSRRAGLLASLEDVHSAFERKVRRPMSAVSRHPDIPCSATTCLLCVGCA